MSRYVVFVTEDEEAWEAKSDAERQEVYDADARVRPVARAARRQGDRRRRAEADQHVAHAWSTAAASPAGPPVRTPSASSSSAASTSWSATDVEAAGRGVRRDDRGAHVHVAGGPPSSTDVPGECRLRGTSPVIAVTDSDDQEETT